MYAGKISHASAFVLAATVNATGEFPREFRPRENKMAAPPPKIMSRRLRSYRSVPFLSPLLLQTSYLEARHINYNPALNYSLTDP